VAKPGSRPNFNGLIKLGSEAQSYGSVFSVAHSAEAEADQLQRLFGTKDEKQQRWLKIRI